MELIPSVAKGVGGLGRDSIKLGSLTGSRLGWGAG